MTLNAPVDVRLYNADTDVNIGRRLSALTYRSAIPGGFASAELTFEKPLAAMADELAAYTNVVVTHTETGEVVWQGNLEEPGPSVFGDGQLRQMQATGASVRATDIQTSRHYIDAEDAFYKRLRFNAAATAEVGPTPDGTGSPPAVTSEEAIVITAPGGTVLGNGLVGVMMYDRLVGAGQQLGGIGYTRLAGKADAGYQNELAVHADDGSPAGVTTVASSNWTASSVAMGPFVVGTDWTAGMDVARLNVRRSGGATTIADDASWGAFYNVYVAARRLLADGSFAANAAHANAYVLASEVFADLIGAGLLPFDGATAVIAASTYHIDRFAYPDGATPQQILDDALALDPAYYWAAWEGSPPRCEFAAWPTTPTHVVDVDDGYEAPQSGAELFDQAVGRWVDGRDRVRMTPVIQATTGLLVDVGIHRRVLLDLGAEIGSAANATQMVNNYLADHAYPPNGGTVTIRRPVQNLKTGRLEQPSQLRPGGLFAINGVDAYPDALNATGRDGVAIVRPISTEYDAASNSVTCELDSYSRALARSLRRARRRRPLG